MSAPSPPPFPPVDPGSRPPGRRRRWLRRTLWLLGLLILVAGALAALLPRLVSSDWVRHRMTATASERLGRAVTLGALEFSWAGTFALRDLTLADAPRFGAEPLLRLGTLEIRLEGLGLLSRDLDMQVSLHGLHLRGVRETAGTTNLDALLADAGLVTSEPAAPEPAATDAAASGPILLPVTSLRVRLRLDELALNWDDQATGHRARVRDGSVHLDAASDGSPVVFSARAELVVDDNPLPPIHLAAELRDLFGPDNEVHPERAGVSIDGRLPGIGIRSSAEPGSGTPEVRAEVAVDLPAVLAAARPFLPPDLSSLNLAGALTLDASAVGDPQRVTEFEVTLDGVGLRAQGGPLGGRAAGPLDLSTRHRGSLRQTTGELTIDEGRVDLGPYGNVSWTARAALPGADPVAQPGKVEAAVGPLRLDLDALVRLAAPFLPPELARSLALEAGSLDLRAFRVAGPLHVAPDPPTAHQITLDDLSLKVGGLHYRPSAKDTAGGAVRGLSFGLTGFSAALRGGFPERTAGTALLEVARVELFGPTPVEITGLSLPDLRFAGRDLTPEASATGGLAGSFEMDQRLSVAEVQLPGTVGLVRVRESLHLNATTHPNGRLDARVRDLAFATSQTEATAGGGTWSLKPAAAGGDALRLEVSSLDLTGKPATGDLTSALQGLALELAHVSGAQGDTRLELEGLRLGVPALSAGLERHHPRQADLNLDLELAELQLTGPQEATLSGLRLTIPELAADELGPEPRRAFGWAGRARLRQELTVERVQVPGQASLFGLTQDLSLTAALEDPAAVVRVPRLRLSALVGDTGMLPVRPVPLRVDLQIPTATLRGTAPADMDLEGMALRAALGDALTARLGLSARAGGAGATTTDGDLSVDLKLLSRLVPPELLRKAELTGRVSADWEARGRLPSEAETEELRADPAVLLGRAERLPFVDGATLRVSLDGVGVDYPLDPGRVAIGGVFTQPELRVEVGPRGSTLGIAGGLDLRWIEELPGLPRLAEPWSARLDWGGELATDASVSVRESFALAPVGVSQTLDLNLAGLEKLEAGGETAPLFRALHGVDADLKLTATIAENPVLTALAPGIQVQGPLDAGANLTLRAGREVAGAAWLRAQNAALVLPGVARVEGLDAAVQLARRLAIVRDTQTPGAVAQGDRYLSRAVLELPGPVPSSSPAPDPTSADDMGQPSRVALRRLQYTGGPLPLDAGNLELTFSLPGHLPHLERFQADLLGGTVRGGLRLGTGTGADRYHLQGSVGFTGLDAARLVPGAAPSPGTGVPGDDSEISGQLGFRVPLVPDVSALLDGIGLEAGLTHVGARTLDRVLFALDPSESNEAIVGQRRMVRLGSPRWFSATLKDGNLATAGQVRALGVDLSLPRIERFPVSRLPVLADLANREPQLRSLIDTLDLISADHVAVSRGGGLSFYRGETP